MSPEEIAAWVDAIELDVANVGSADDCWSLREQARLFVFESRGLKPPPADSGGLWAQPPGLVE
jgi:hypothetical protein